MSATDLDCCAVDASAKSTVPRLPSRGNAKAERERLAGRRTPIAFLRRQFAHPGIEQPRALRPGFVGFPRRGGVKSRYASPLSKIACAAAAMQREPLRLLVLLVPAEVEPPQALEDGVQ